MKYKDVVKDILSKRDPQGYYIIPLKDNPKLLMLLTTIEGLIIDRYGDIIIVKTRSRDLVKKILRKAITYNSLVSM